MWLARIYAYMATHQHRTPEEIAAITGGDPDGIRRGMAVYEMVDADDDNGDGDDESD